MSLICGRKCLCLFYNDFSMETLDDVFLHEYFLQFISLRCEVLFTLSGDQCHANRDL